MRLFLMLLIVAISISGYSAAAHDFGNSGQIEMDDCHGLHKKPVEKDKSSDQKPLECAHCCIPQVFNETDFSVHVFIQDIILSPLAVQTYLDKYPPSLFRPPINLM